MLFCRLPNQQQSHAYKGEIQPSNRLCYHHFVVWAWFYRQLSTSLSHTVLCSSNSWTHIAQKHNIPTKASLSRYLTWSLRAMISWFWYHKCMTYLQMLVSYSHIIYTLLRCLLVGKEIFPNCHSMDQPKRFSVTHSLWVSSEFFVVVDLGDLIQMLSSRCEQNVAALCLYWTSCCDHQTICIVLAVSQTLLSGCFPQPVNVATVYLITQFST